MKVRSVVAWRLTISSPAFTAMTSRAPARSKTMMEERILRVDYVGTGFCDVAGLMERPES